MRPHDPAGEPRHAGAKDYAPEPLLLHRGHAQLRQEKGRSTVGAPCRLEFFHGDILDGLEHAFADDAGVVEEDRRRAQLLHDLCVQRARSFVL